MSNSPKTVVDPITGKRVRVKAAKNRAGGPVRGAAPPAPTPRVRPESFEYGAKGTADCREQRHLSDFADALDSDVADARERAFGALVEFRNVVVDRCIAAARLGIPGASDEAAGAWEAIDATETSAEAQAREKVDRAVTWLADGAACAASDIAGPLNLDGYDAPDADAIAATIGEHFAGKFATEVEALGEVLARQLTPSLRDALVAGIRRV